MWWQHLTEIHTRLRETEVAAADHRRELSEAMGQVEALSSALHARGGALERAASDRAALQRDLDRLRLDLRAVQQQAEQYQAEADALRQERLARADPATPLARGGASSDHLHAAHIQGLLVQIRYLKAKFVREADLRADLGHQKTYVARLAAGLRATDAYTTRFLADLVRSRGTPAANRPRQTPGDRFRAAGRAVCAMVRMRQMAQRWAYTSQVRDAMREARRAATAHKQTG